MADPDLHQNCNMFTLNYCVGAYEPKEDECEWPSDSEDEETELSDGVKEKVFFSPFSENPTCSPHICT